MIIKIGNAEHNIESASYLSDIFDYKKKKLIVANGRKYINEKFPPRKRKDLALAGIGLSGALFTPALAESLNIPFTIIRKNRERSHSYYINEGCQSFQRYIFVDDLIDSGRSLERVVKKLKGKTLIGIILYASSFYAHIIYEIHKKYNCFAKIIGPEDMYEYGDNRLNRDELG